MREAYQSKIGQRILNSNLLVHLNPNFRESGLHTYIHKWLPYQILGGKIVENVSIDPQTMEIWFTDLKVTLSVSERVSGSVSDTLDRERLSNPFPLNISTTKIMLKVKVEKKEEQNEKKNPKSTKNHDIF